MNKKLAKRCSLIAVLSVICLGLMLKKRKSIIEENIKVDLLGDKATYDENEGIVKATPCIKNIGNTPVYIRVYSDVLNTLYKDLVIISLNWGKSEDGYYCYKKVLNPGEVSEPLFKDIRVESLRGCSLDLELYCDAIAAKGYKDYMEAFSEGFC